MLKVSREIGSSTSSNKSKITMRKYKSYKDVYKMSRDSGMQRIELNAGEHLQPVWFKDSNTALGIKNKFKFAEKVLIVGGSNDRQIDLREYC